MLNHYIKVEVIYTIVASNSTLLQIILCAKTKLTKNNVESKNLNLGLQKHSQFEKNQQVFGYSGEFAVNYIANQITKNVHLSIA